MEPFDPNDPTPIVTSKKRAWLLHFELSEEFAWLKVAFWLLVVLAVCTVILLVVLHFTEGPDTFNWFGR